MPSNYDGKNNRNQLCCEDEEGLFIKPLFDAMWTGEWIVAALAERCYDVQQIMEVRPDLEHDDEAIFEYAAKKGRLLATCNEVDFITIAHKWNEKHEQPHAGILIVQDEDRSLRKSQVLRRMLYFLDSYTADEMKNILLHLPRAIRRE